MTESFLGMSEELADFLIPLLIFCAVLLLWALVSWILTGISLNGIGRTLKIRASWIAWIPLARICSIGAIADRQDARHGKDHKFRRVLVWLLIAYVASLAGYILMYSRYLNSILLAAAEAAAAEPAQLTEVFWGLLATAGPLVYVSAGMTAVEYICFYKLMELCKPESPLKTMLIGIMVPFAFPFVLLSCRRSLRDAAGEEVSANEG